MAYDGKGYWRNPGEGFYDAKGYWRNPGEGFYDAKGYWRNPGEGFYDAKGNWVNPGAGFYDSKGEFNSPAGGISTDYRGSGMFLVVVILAVPIFMVWLLVEKATDWLLANFYLAYSVFLILGMGYSLVVAKIRKYAKVSFVISILGNFLCIMALAYVMFIYAVPYFLEKQNFWGFFELILSLGFTIFGVVIVQFLDYYFEKPIVELILGIIYFALVCIILRNNSGMDLKEFMGLYNLHKEGIAKLICGLILK